MKSIDFLPNNRLISHIELSTEAIASAERLLKVGNELHKAIEEFSGLLPPGCDHQFYGDWDCLIVRDYHEHESTD